MRKVHSLDTLARICAELRSTGDRIVLCHGVWDLCHPGHALHFAAARKLGDVLVVTLTPDHLVGRGPGRPLFEARWRAIAVASLVSTDYVAINQWATAVETIQLLRPAVYCKGPECLDTPSAAFLQEKAAVEGVGGIVSYTNEAVFSSTELIRRLEGEVQHR